VAEIDIEKSTNGEDADDPPGPTIPVGDPVLWEYEVTNTGDEDLQNVTVTDDQGVTVTCPQTTLPVGESMTCTANGTAVEGQYANLGMATADDPAGNQVTDEDPSHYLGVSGASIDIEKLTNGEDADDPPGPTIPVGDPVFWDYLVTNDGAADLVNVVVEDDQGVSVSCPQTTLAVGETMTCTANGTAVEGQYANLGTATGDDATTGETVSDQDPSHYFGEIPNDPPDCESATADPDRLWPPNHKFVAISVLVTDPNGDPVTVTIDSIFQDEPVDSTGDGSHVPDGSGVGTETAEVRAERMGSANGRVYHIAFTADDGQGGVCSGEVLVGVPKSQGGGEPVDDGALFDSTVIP
jgi:hypothetical protein